MERCFFLSSLGAQLRNWWLGSLPHQVLLKVGLRRQPSKGLGLCKKQGILRYGYFPIIYFKKKKNHLAPVQLIMLKGGENLLSTDQTIQRAAKGHQPLIETAFPGKLVLSSSQGSLALDSTSVQA